MSEYGQMLTPENIEAELCYAYVHAVAASAGVECIVSGRHSDNRGVDARLVSWQPFPEEQLSDSVQIEVQLKATTAAPVIVDDAYAYALRDILLYDSYRRPITLVPRIVVVLFLPQDQEQWLSHDVVALSLRRCAYWVSLRGASATRNTTSQTIYLPMDQPFNPQAVTTLMSRTAHGVFPRYQESVV